MRGILRNEKVLFEVIARLSSCTWPPQAPFGCGYIIVLHVVLFVCKYSEALLLFLFCIFSGQYMYY